MYEEPGQKGLEGIRLSISSFLAKQYKGIIVVVVVFAVLLVGAGVLAVRNGSIKNESAELAEEIEVTFQEYLNESEEITKTELQDKLLSLIEKGKNNYKNQYAHQRALFISGHYYYSSGQFKEASDAYYSLYEKFSKSYLASIALYNASVCEEEDGNDEKAIEYLSQLISVYGGQSPLVPQSLFTLGRISEKNDDQDKALESYQRLEDSYPTSNWTKLAKQRIIVLTL